MTYRVNSQWNEENELKCLVIFKKLEFRNFPRGEQIKYCRDMAKDTKLSPENISAKVCNFKSVAGINNKSNASKNTISIYKKYRHLSINEIEKLLKSVLSLIHQFTLLAEYNQLMNQRQYKAAASLSESMLCEDKGASFKSVLGTLNHIMVGDIIWLKRFAKQSSDNESLSYIQELKKPKSLDEILFTDLEELRKEREIIDKVIIHWVCKLTDKDLNECISYKNMAGKSFIKPFSSLINHLFLHQTHHRGQATTLLAQYGVNFGETDIIEIINECKECGV